MDIHQANMGSATSAALLDMQLRDTALWVDSQKYGVLYVKPRPKGWLSLHLCYPYQPTLVCRVIEMPIEAATKLLGDDPASVIVSGCRIRRDPAREHYGAGFYPNLEEAMRSDYDVKPGPFNGLQGKEGQAICWDANAFAGMPEPWVSLGWQVHGWRFDPGHNRWCCLVTDADGRLFWTWPVNFGGLSHGL